MTYTKLSHIPRKKKKTHIACEQLVLLSKHGDRISRSEGKATRLQKKKKRKEEWLVCYEVK